MYVAGQVKRVVHHSGSFYILDLGIQESDLVHRNSITVAGNLFGIDRVRSDTHLWIQGEITQHAKFGRQVTITTWKPWAPKAYIWLWLSTCIGFEPEVAKALVEAFGADTFDILSKDPKKAQDTLKNLHPSDVSDALVRWQRAMATRDLSDVLKDGGLNSFEIDAAVRRFGSEAASIVKDNPFRLMEIPGYNFGKVDQFSFRMGVPRSSLQRLEGIALNAISEEAKNGHLYVKRGDIEALTRKIKKPLWDLPYGKDPGLTRTLKTLQERKAICVDPEAGAYLPDYYRYERDAATMLGSLMAPSKLEVDLVAFLDQFEQGSQMELSEAQKDAVRKLVDHKVLVLTGLPGTGKTTAVRALVRLFESARLSFALMAPTGIAAKRLSHVTGQPAFTIHKTLGYNGTEWAHNHNNHFIVDAVIVDEVSMVDQELFYRLLSSLRDDTMLVLVGDDAQLPSVGPGSVLRELVACDKLPRVRLTKIFRQSEQSDIVLNSHKINNGERLELGTPRGKSEFKFLSVGAEEKVLDFIVKMASRLKEKDTNFQVLAPKYGGTVGVDALNDALRETLNPPGPPEWAGHKQRFRVGDRVMIVKNNYKKNVYNGDVGKLAYIGNDRLVVHVYGVGNDTDAEVVFTEGEADDLLRPAYAITVHKCVDPETLVETSRGLVQARDLLSEGEVATPTGRASYQNLVRNKSSTLLEIETTDGYSLRVTPDHGVDAWSGTGYIRTEAQALCEGQFLRLRLGAEFTDPGLTRLPTESKANVRSSLHPLPEYVTESAAEFLGLFVADGTVFQRGFRLAKRHLDVADRFAQLCVELFEVTPKRFYTNNAHHVEVASTQIASWLNSIGGLSPNEKFVPDAVLRSSISIQCRFLKGLFEDGTVNLKGDKLDHVELHSVSERVLRSVRVMLLRLGVISGCGESKIYIYGLNAKRFAEKVGFVARFKTARLEATSGMGTKYLVPVSRSEALEIAEANGGRSVLTHTDKNVFARGTMSRHQLADFLARMRVRTAAWEALNSRLGFHHSRIRSISTYQGESVCVEVPEGHQFIQDGFCGWNCQGSEFDHIILPVLISQGRMLQRNLLYTAVTRAKKQVWLVGDRLAIQRAVSNDKVQHRNTQLCEAVLGVLDPDGGDLRSAVGETEG